MGSELGRDYGEAWAWVGSDGNVPTAGDAGGGVVIGSWWQEQGGYTGGEAVAELGWEAVTEDGGKVFSGWGVALSGKQGTEVGCNIFRPRHRSSKQIIIRVGAKDAAAGTKG